MPSQHARDAMVATTGAVLAGSTIWAFVGVAIRAFVHRFRHSHI